jgi:tetratricopeptide (TPR) repeat protein
MSTPPSDFDYDHLYREVQEYLEKAQRVRKEGNHWESERILEEGLSEHSSNPYLLAAIGDVYVRTGRFEEALAVTEQVIELHPGIRDAHMVKGNVLYAWRQFEEALVHYRHAADLRKDRYLESRILNSLIKLERFEEALRYVQSALERKPASITFLRYLARIYEKLGMTGDAEKVLQKIIHRKRGDRGASRNLLRFGMKRRLPKETIEELDRFLDRNRASPGDGERG